MQVLFRPIPTRPPCCLHGGGRRGCRRACSCLRTTLQAAALGHLVADGERVSAGTAVAGSATMQQATLRQLTQINDQIDLLQRSQNTTSVQLESLRKNRSAALYDLMVTWMRGLRGYRCGEENPFWPRTNQSSPARWPASPTRSRADPAGRHGTVPAATSVPDRGPADGLFHPPAPVPGG